MLCCSAVTLLVAIAFGVLWASLPTLISRAVNSDRNTTNVERLRLAHQMAGGLTDPLTADKSIADAIKALALSSVVGAKAEARFRGVPADSRAAWQQLMQTLREAESSYLTPAMRFGLGPPEHASGEIAEGLRYVSHVTRLALELYVEPSPRFVRFVSPSLKMLGDNPDALYYIARLDATRAYEVSGCRAGEAYFSLSVHAASQGTSFPRVIADLNDERLRFDERGCFRVVLSPDTAPPADLPSGASWLHLSPASESVVTRHYFEANPPAQLDRKLEARVALSLQIVERGLGGEGGEATQPLTDAEMAARLDRADGFVRLMTVGNEAPDPATAPPFFALRPNEIGPPQKWSRDSEGVGAVDIAYAGGRFLLRPGEALVIRGTMPTCRFANVVLWNRFLQTLDYSRSQPVWRSRARLHLTAEGGFTIVLAAESPFADEAHERSLHANWISSEGRATATMFFRFVLPEGPIAQPRTQVVPVGKVLSALGTVPDS